MDETAEFHHEATPLTVAQLRTALEGVPDEAQVRVFYAEEPGGATVDEQVAISFWHHDEQDSIPAPGWFTIEAEFPTGDYLRREA